MPTPGYLYWSDDWFRLNPWLVDGFIQQLVSLDWEEVSPLVRIPTHGGTHVIQRPYTGDTAPVVRIAFAFNCSFQGMFYADYQKMKDALMTGDAINWSPGLWAREYFSAAGSFKLSRPVAWGTVTGCDSTTFPQTGATSISGQDVVMAGAGTVNYYPLFKVIVESMSQSVPQVNGLDFTARLVECIEVV